MGSTSFNSKILSGTCRVCLEDCSKLYPLEGPILNVDVYISTMITYCTSIEVNMDDNLPKGVCIPCFKTIRIAYNFIKQFKETNDILCAEKSLKEVKYEDNLKEQNSANDIDFSEEPDVTAISNIENHSFSEHEDELQVSSNEQIFSEEELDSSFNSSEEKIIIQCITEDNNVNGNCTSTHILPESNGNEVSEHETEITKEPGPRTILSTYLCPICCKMFSDFNRGLIKHIRHHHKDNLFKCDRCSLETELNVDTYVQHYTKTHLYQCNFCEKRLKSKSSFYYHLNNHDETTSYICPHCNKSFHNMLNLRKHLPVHSNVPKYVCSKCGKKFKTYDTFRYHNKTHDGKRNHLCSVCGRSFLQSVHLKYHMWHHTGIKQFQCSDCGRSYTSVTQLNKHRRKYCGSSNSGEESKV